MQKVTLSDDIQQLLYNLNKLIIMDIYWISIGKLRRKGC
jgi:hypothetical protein